MRANTRRPSPRQHQPGNAVLLRKAPIKRTALLIPARPPLCRPPYSFQHTGHAEVAHLQYLGCLQGRSHKQWRLLKHERVMGTLMLAQGCIMA